MFHKFWGTLYIFFNNFEITLSLEYPCGTWHSRNLTLFMGQFTLKFHTQKDKWKTLLLAVNGELC
jgi:hypothetical protein